MTIHGTGSTTRADARRTLTLRGLAEEPVSPNPLTEQELDRHIRELVPKLMWRLQYNGTMATSDIYAATWERVWRVQREEASSLSPAYVQRAIRHLILDQKRAQARRRNAGFERADVDPDAIQAAAAMNGERMVEVQSDAMACALIVEALRQGIGTPRMMRADTRANHARVLEAILENPHLPDARIAHALGLSPQTYASRKKSLTSWIGPLVRGALTEANMLGRLAEQVLEGATEEERAHLREAAKR